MSLPDVHNNSTTNNQNNNNASAYDTEHRPMPPASPRIGIHNPNSLHPTSTVIGLGTVGLGDRCRKEKKLLHKQNFARWCDDKAKEAYQRKIAEGGSTPKKPQTSKEAYQAKKNGHFTRLAKLDDQQTDSARKHREAAQALKAQFVRSRQEHQEFYEEFTAEAREQEKHHYASAFKAEREKQREGELSARQQAIKELCDQEEAVDQELLAAEEAAHKARIEYDHIIATTIDKNAHEAQKVKLEAKQAIVKKVRDSLARKRRLRLELDKDRLSEFKSTVKTTKTQLADEVEKSRDKMILAKMSNAEQMREAKTRAQSQSPRHTGNKNLGGSLSQSMLSASSPSQSADARKQQVTEHNAIIEQSAVRRRENADLFRLERQQQLAISDKDFSGEAQYRKELHDYTRDKKKESAGNIVAFQEARLASIRAEKPHREGGSPVAAAAPVNQDDH